jgi:mannitol PTS system EIIA component
MKPNPPILSPDKIVVHATPADKSAAIVVAGTLLAQAGHVESSYIDAMLAREREATTYLGNGVAVPHGSRESMALVRSPGISIVQVPGGVDFGGGNVARLVVGLAANGDGHIDLLSSLAEICSDDERLNQLLSADTPQKIIDILQQGMSG